MSFVSCPSFVTSQHVYDFGWEPFICEYGQWKVRKDACKPFRDFLLDDCLDEHESELKEWKVDPTKEDAIYVAKRLEFRKSKDYMFCDFKGIVSPYLARKIFAKKFPQEKKPIFKCVGNSRCVIMKRYLFRYLDEILQTYKKNYGYIASALGRNPSEYALWIQVFIYYFFYKLSDSCSKTSESVCGGGLCSNQSVCCSCVVD